MKIRPATNEDIGNLAHLMQIADNRPKEWAQTRIRSYLSEPEQEILVTENNILIGYAGVKCFEDDHKTRKIIGDKINNYACLTWVASHPDHRNQGVAKSLIEHCQTWSIENGRTGMWLDCRKNLVAFYERLGFQKAGFYMDNKELRFVFVKEF